MVVKTARKGCLVGRSRELWGWEMPMRFLIRGGRMSELLEWEQGQVAGQQRRWLSGVILNRGVDVGITGIRRQLIEWV
jgi:hypothetical protein